jgi:predicted component of type VI protein secretion system
VPALIIKEGPLAGQRFELDAEVIVGRENAPITIQDPELSRRHAAIRPADEGFEIEDLGSLNGTFVNGRKIEEVTPLEGGDIIRVGTTSFELEAPVRSVGTVLSSAPPAPPPAAAATPAVPVEHAPAPAAPPAPAPPPVAAQEPAPATAPPSEPFGTFSAAPVAGGRTKIASRRLTPTALSFGAVIATAIALVIYFAQH